MAALRLLREALDLLDATPATPGRVYNSWFPTHPDNLVAIWATRQDARRRLRRDLLDLEAQIASLPLRLPDP